jgi:hypothetical protein
MNLSKLTLCAVLVLGREALACDCAVSVPPDEAFAQADAVFRGKVVEVRPSNPGRRWEPQYFVVRFKIRTAWKGATTSEFTLGTGVGGGDCGKHFTQGAEYVVYAYRIQRPADDAALSQPLDDVLPTEFTTHICTRTAELKQAGEDLHALKSRKPLPLRAPPRRAPPPSPKK